MKLPQGSTAEDAAWFRPLNRPLSTHLRRVREKRATGRSGDPTCCRSVVVEVEATRGPRFGFGATAVPSNPGAVVTRPACPLGPSVSTLGASSQSFRSALSAESGLWQGATTPSTPDWLRIEQDAISEQDRRWHVGRIGLLRVGVHKVDQAEGTMLVLKDDLLSNCGNDVPAGGELSGEFVKVCRFGPVQSDGMDVVLVDVH